MNALLSILAFGVLLAYLHNAAPVTVRALTTTEWVVVTLGIGVLGGTLFHLFLGEERGIDRLWIALGGAVMLTSGAADYLQLSPALATLAMGVILVNSLRNPTPVVEVLRAGERPLYYVLLLLAGASWTPDRNIVWWLVIAHYVVLRTMSKLWGTGITTWLNRAQQSVGIDWGRALIGQGRLTLALAFYYSQRDLPFGDVIFTCSAVSVLFTEFFAARFVRSATLPLLAPLEQLKVTTDAVVESMTETVSHAIPRLRRTEQQTRDEAE